MRHISRHGPQNALAVNDCGIQHHSCGLVLETGAWCLNCTFYAEDPLITSVVIYLCTQCAGRWLCYHPAAAVMAAASIR